MADEPAQQDAPETPQDAPKPTPPAREADEGTDWKAEARKWEQRAKANADAATRLAQIEDASKTEAQRAAEAQAAAEERAAEAEARALRRDVALEHSLTKDDAALLDGITDEDVMRALAATSLLIFSVSHVARLNPPMTSRSTGPKYA